MENTMTMSKSYEQKMLERRSELFEQARGDEVLEKRRENIKQFHLGHGRYQAVVFPEPVHYQEDGDGWKDIDNNLEDATDAAGRPILRNRANALRVELSKSADSGKLARIESSGHVLEWSLDGIFDCSSLVARAYSAQGKRWKYGGSVPTSNKEIYDDDFELLWPTTYAQIGKSFGGASVINMAKQPGDLQFLCTDSGTSRANKITHVTMVATPTQIVHARGTKYGVCTNSISLYAGKVCGVVRYNPACALRLGMKGYRTLRLQQALNAHGADIREDGEFGEKTQKALKVFQADHGCGATGETDLATLNALGLNAEVKPLSQSTGSEPSNQNPILVTGGSVHIRTGPGKEYDSVMIAHAGDVLHGIDAEGWNPILLDGEVRWISQKYSQAQNA